MNPDFSQRLLDWFDLHGRKDLPWQHPVTPYRVWISEIMLQQTRVQTVIPFFNRFMQAFPDIRILARADEDAVLHQWTGLGYYARARNLHEAARIVASRHGGRLPLEIEALISLPGIGRSTAGAIVSICANRPAPILDGNVKRVLCRYFAVDGWPGATATARRLWEIAEQLTPSRRVADYTQAIMDLGATCCTRSSPDCPACPLSDDCIARKEQRIETLPERKPKKRLPVRSTTMLICENPAGQWLLLKRPPAGLWGGLWGFPEGEDMHGILDELAIPATAITSRENLPPFRHSFTHFHLEIDPVHVTLHRTPDTLREPRSRWISPADTGTIGLTAPVTRLIRLFSPEQTGKRQTI